MTKDNQAIVTPLALIGSFNGMFSTVAQKIVTVRGIYRHGRSREFTSNELGAHWFDELSDEASTQKITLIVPSRLRFKLEPERCIVMRGYVHPKIKSGGTVEVQFVVTEMLEQKTRELDPMELARFEVLRNRINIPYQNVDALLGQAFFRGQQPKVIAIYGEAAVVSADVQKALRNIGNSIDLQEH